MVLASREKQCRFPLKKIKHVIPLFLNLELCYNLYALVKKMFSVDFVIFFNDRRQVGFLHDSMISSNSIHCIFINY